MLLTDYYAYSNENFSNFSSRSSDRSWFVVAFLQLNGGILMKIVVVKSPKLLTPLLRFIFKIKKESL